MNQSSNVWIFDVCNGGYYCPSVDTRGAAIISPQRRLQTRKVCNGFCNSTYSCIDFYLNLTTRAYKFIYSNDCQVATVIFLKIKNKNSGLLFVFIYRQI